MTSKRRRATTRKRKPLFTGTPKTQDVIATRLTCVDCAAEQLVLVEDDRAGSVCTGCGGTWERSEVAVPLSCQRCHSDQGILFVAMGRRDYICVPCAHRGKVSYMTPVDV